MATNFEKWRETRSKSWCDGAYERAKKKFRAFNNCEFCPADRSCPGNVSHFHCYKNFLKWADEMYTGGLL